MPKIRTSLPLAIAWLAGLCAGLLAVWLLDLQTDPTTLLPWIADRFASFTTVFLGIFIEAAPFLLMGTLASGLVEVYLRKDWLVSRLPGNVLAGSLLGGSLGMVFPVGECGTVPLTRRLFSKGLPLSIGIAFLLAAPVVNPIVIASTAAAFGFGPMVFWRILLSMVIAVLVGLIFSVEKVPGRLLKPLPYSALADPHHPASTAAEIPAPKLQQALLNAGNEFFEMGRYLVIGSLLAAMIQAFLPQTAFLEISKGPFLSVLVMIAMAFVLSVGSTVDSFVALAFVSNFSPGSILAFLVYGAMIDIKGVLMLAGVFRRRAVLYLILLPLVMTTVAAVAINLFLPWG